MHSLNNINYISNLFSVDSVIGTPEKEQWPENTSLPWQSFKHHGGVDLQHLVLDMCPEGIDLLKVSIIWKAVRHFCLKAYCLLLVL